MPGESYSSFLSAQVLTAMFQSDVQDLPFTSSFRHFGSEFAKSSWIFLSQKQSVSESSHLSPGLLPQTAL